MDNPVGYRFRPTDLESIEDYVLPKNLDSDTTRVDRVISTLNICSFDPWELPSQSILKSRDQVWFFFGVKDNKYNRGDRQSRKTKSGFWKITGKPKEIKRNNKKIGEKKFLVFHFNGSKTNWVMHEYHAETTNQMMMTYTICKVKFKGEESEMSLSSGSKIKQSQSLITDVNNNSGGLSTGSEGLTSESLQSQELETPLEDEIKRVFGLSDDEWINMFSEDKQSLIVSSTQEDCSAYRPKKPLTSVFIGHSSDGSDSDSISATTGSIQTLSTCNSFGSSNHGIDQISDLQESPNSTIELSQKVSQALGQQTEIGQQKLGRGTEIGEQKLGQEIIKKKRGGFFYRTIQRFVKKISLCSFISRK